MIWRGWGKGPGLVLLHGGQGSWAHWVRNIADLAKHYEVWVVDLPGMGESAMPLEPWNEKTIAMQLVESTQTILKGSFFDLVGFSFGGLIAGHMAALHPAMLRSLTLVGAPALGLPVAKLDLRRWRGIPEGNARDEVHRHNMLQLMIGDVGSVDELALAIQRFTNEVVELRSRSLALGDSLSQALAKVAVPTHGIWGMDDVLVRGQHEALKTILARFNVGLEFIPAAGHWVQYERAAQFDKALRTWLNRVANLRGVNQSAMVSGL